MRVRPCLVPPTPSPLSESQAMEPRAHWLRDQARGRQVRAPPAPTPRGLLPARAVRPLSRHVTNSVSQVPVRAGTLLHAVLLLLPAPKEPSRAGQEIGLG